MDRLASSYAVINPTIRARALSLAARAHWEKYEAALASTDELATILRDEEREAERLGIATTYKAEEDPITILATAMHRANESIKLGLFSAATMVVGLGARDSAAAAGIQDTELVVKMPMFADLWGAVLKRLRNLDGRQKAQERKADRRPNEYICAALGCGIGASQRAGLRACAGGCPKELKPSYCSKECQRKVRAL